MNKRLGTVIVWLLVGALLASCKPGGEPGATPTPPTSGVEPAPTATLPPPVETPDPSAGVVECQGRIAFVGRTDGDQDIFVVNADGSGLVNVTSEAGSEWSPSWSPDGAQIVFSRHVGNSDIYIIQSDGSGSVRLTDHPARDYSPAWSPDGSQVLFGSTRVFASDLFLTGVEGGEAVPLTGMAAHKTDFAWSPDGSRIAFTMLDGYNQGDVYLLAVPGEEGAAGGGSINLTQHPAHDCCVDWSPDGQRLLFLSSRNGEGAGIWSAGQGNAYPDTNLLVRARASGSTSDVVRAVTTVMPKPVKDIYLIHSDGSGLVRLTDGTGREKHASWSPQGDRLAFVSDRDGNDEIYVLAVPEGAAPGAGGWTRLTSSPEDDGYPTWSPDGTCLAFQSRRDGTVELWVLDVGGAGLKRIADNVVSGGGLDWAP